jgi:endonuclease III
MKQIDDKHRYHQTKNANDESKHRYKAKNHSQYTSSRRDDRFNSRINTDFSNQRNDYQYQKSTSKTYSYFPPPQPLMSKEIPPPPSLVTVIPHERESWIRSVKKTNINESTEQKTQYLETMLRMPQQQQKSSIDSSTFDRMRFADDQISTTINSINTENNLDENAFQLIRDINNHEDICTLENILFNNQLPTTMDKHSNQKLLPSSSVCILMLSKRQYIPSFSVLFNRSPIANQLQK